MGDTLIQFKGTIYEAGFGQVSKLVMQDETLSKSAKLIYAYICTFGSGAFPSRRRICSDLKVGKTTVTDSLKQLIQSGYITVEQKRDANGLFSHNVYIVEFVKR